MPRSPYSAEQKAHALLLVGEHGIAYAHRETHISKPTLSRWATNAGVKRSAVEQTAEAAATNHLAWEQRRGQMVHEIGRVADKALATTEQAIDADDVRRAKDAATTMAILIDKAQLLVGGATSRYGSETERKHVVDEARERSLRLVPSQVDAA